MLPAASFIKVGKHLKDENYESSHELSWYTQGEASSSIHLLDHGTGGSKTSFITLRSKGVLILDGEESKDFTVESVDIDTYNEMHKHLSRKNRLFFFVTIFLSITASFLLYEIQRVGKREQYLSSELLKVKKEQEKILEQSWKRKNECPVDEPMFQLQTCYFHIETSASLGECGKNLKTKLLTWYEDTIYEAYSAWWNDIFGGNTKDDSGKSNDIKKHEGSIFITSFNEDSLHESNQNEWRWQSDNFFE